MNLPPANETDVTVLWPTEPGLEPSWVLQEFIIGPDGEIEVPWIAPRATDLLLTAHRAVGGRFAVQPIQGNIYCG